MRPSFIASTLSGLIIFIAIILFIINYKTLVSDNKYFINTLILLSIAIGIHGLSHYFEEIYIDFNPLIGKWKPKDKPEN